MNSLRVRAYASTIDSRQDPMARLYTELLNAALRRGSITIAAVLIKKSFPLYLEKVGFATAQFSAQFAGKYSDNFLAAKCGALTFVRKRLFA
jgi:hypothetical protein